MILNDRLYLCDNAIAPIISSSVFNRSPDFDSDAGFLALLIVTTSFSNRCRISSSLKPSTNALSSSRIRRYPSPIASANDLNTASSAVTQILPFQSRFDPNCSSAILDYNIVLMSSSQNLLVPELYLPIKFLIILFFIISPAMIFS